MVKGGNSEWFKEIKNSIEEAVKQEEWKSGRAVFVLCEDIKTALELNAYITDKGGYERSKVYLYARSNSTELQSIQHKFKPGEIVIATNLWSRNKRQVE